ncbi:hypothetical protein Csp1_26530 [Corynebacterium provencense]|uniref:Purine catabolism PurC-like domain-containing protein n=1 Tax=Corynebacterium provencense TaxID=1737425 RepID=A0A2Z3YRA1_9CORY|nr:PucR family transcriptional regulator ligand-binding domain-containing protein [Corynebacterium provencense]AWT27396.1 hypothetical protein Csp1_26530 [Corynebacterium provencense]
MLVADLITDPELHLELATPSPIRDLEKPVRAAVVTESMTPTAYLEPDTLLLTTGIGMNFEDARIWEAYVERLVTGRVSAVAFGIGQPHRKVPAGLTAAAHAAGLPVLTVPTDVPFLQLQHSVNQSIASERYYLSRQAWDLAAHCTRAAGRGAGVDELVHLIEDRAGVDVVVLDDSGHRFAGTASPDARQRAGDRGGARATVGIPLPVSGEATWQLCVREEESRDLRTLLTPATAILSMALSRQFENPAPVVWPLLDEVVGNPTVQGFNRLAGEITERGVPTLRGSVVLRVSSRSPVRRNLLAHRVGSFLQPDHRTLTLPVTDAVFVLVADGRGPGQSPESGAVSVSVSDLSRLLRDGGAVDARAGDAVLVSEPVRGTGHLVLEIRRLLGRRSEPGVWVVGRPDTDDIVDLVPAALQEALATAVLDPVLSSPESARMLATLSALLSTSTTTAAAEVAGVHRNTFLSDRRRLERRLAMDLGDAGNRVVCTVALALLRRDGSGPAA